MTATARFGGVCGGALLALSLLVGVPGAGAAPKDDEPYVFTCTETTDTDGPDELGSHPSGKDRSDEAGNSGTQGRSNSDPDGTTNGGSDKPECERGYPWDADTDQDGNNGCGNDDDFEDDNNGNCGKGRMERPAADEPVALFGAPEEEPVEEPAPASAAVEEEEEPAPVVEKPVPLEEPEEEPEGPIVWADPDQDDSGDPDPDEEYPSSDPAPEEPPADDPGTEAPDMDLAANHDGARQGGVLAAGLLAAAGALMGGGRLVGARARRRLMG